MEKFVQNTLKKIKEQNLKPEPRWKYLAIKYSLWGLFVIAAMAGAVAISAAVYLFGDLDWDLSGQVKGNPIFFALAILPYFWIGLIILFLVLGFFEIRRTESGYRYSVKKIIAILLLTLSAFAIFATIFSWGKKADHGMIRIMPFYNKTVTNKESQWSRPSQGFLGGTILRKYDNQIELQDFSGSDWNIETSEKTNIRPSADLSAGKKIKVIGQKKDSQHFEANEIRPWEGKGMNRSMKMRDQGGGK